MLIDHTLLLLGGQRAAAIMQLLLVRLVDRHHATPGVLRGVTGDIRLRHHVLRLIIRGIDNSDPRAGADTVQAAFPDKRVFVDGRHNALADGAGVLQAAIRQQQAEFIAAQARQHVGGAQHSQHQRGEFAQQRVARRMPGGIVHRFKTVEIDIDQRVALMGVADALQQPLEVRLKTDAVSEMGQAVM